MNKTIYDKIDKLKIQQMPKETFSGRIITITSVAEACRAVDYLMKESLLGIDSETRPSFKKNVRYNVALLQISTHDTCFLFRLNMIGMPNCLIQLLEDNNITKVGLSLRDDLLTLERRHRFVPGKFIDIQDEVKLIGIRDCSLQKIYANLFGKMITKRQQLSNWEADTLSDAQKMYASIDAWSCILIHEEIQRLAKSKHYTLIKTCEDNQTDNIHSDKIYEENIS